MAITARLLRTSTPFKLNISSASSIVSNGTSSSLRCLNNLEKRTCSSRNGEPNKSKVAVKASVASEYALSTMESKAKNKSSGLDVHSTVRLAVAALTTVFRPLVKVKGRMSWKLLAEMLIEKGVIDCRFFAMFAVAGSLLGSVLCYVEGFFLILESYFNYFQTMSKGSDEGHVMHLLIEAIGSSMLVFGIGVYVMFVAARNIKNKNGGLFSGSSFFGLFHFKMIPAWIETQTVSQAKSQIGHSVLMILQVGVLEKFKSVPIVTALDLACFAGAVVISSACIFLLSRLSTDGKSDGW
ncbi:hypothetical protein FRX31_011568 [Thalictrum thalictroides]|uniref:Uncharacterized protein n=1 Tax=Thalictrum thalictroides TaxID=46969 RepID=A0A7J6WQW1_THATH|nr:hypothetical protein FRX31_011568 [Thalictrum thalictroides]